VDAHRPDDGAVSPPDTSGTTSTVRPGALRTFLAVLAVLVPVVAGAGVWWWQREEHNQAEAAVAEDAAALKAATREVLAWASVDYRKVDEYFASVKAGATGDFLEQFTQTEEPLRKLLTENKSIQVPTIPKDAAGLLERDGDKARVIVAMDAAVTNTSTKTPQPRQYRLELGLQQVDGEWLVDNLEFVG
jgi:Mce-associated membrane protein